MIRTWKHWFQGKRPSASRPSRRPPSLVERLESRQLLSATNPLAADGYQTQVPVSPSSAGAQSQYVTHGSYQTVSSLSVDLSGSGNTSATGLFDLSFQAQVRSNSASDQVLVRVLVDGNPDAVDLAFGHDLIENLTQNNYGNWSSLSLTEQLTLTPGVTHTIEVQVQDTAAAGSGLPDLVVWNPVLQATGYNTVDSVAAAVGMSQTQTTAQFVAAGNYQTIASLTLNVTAAETGQFALAFQSQVMSNSTSDQVKVRYLIDGNPDPNDLAASQGSGADLIQNLIKPSLYSNWGTLSLSQQLTLGVGTHTITVQIEGTTAAPNANGQDLDVAGTSLALTGYNIIDGQKAASAYQTQTAVSPPGSTSQNITAGSYQTVSSQLLTVGPGVVNLAFQAQVSTGSVNDQVVVRYLIDGLPDPNDLAVGQITGADLIENLTQSNLGSSTSLSLYHQLTLTGGTHVITIQVQDKSTAGNGAPDLVVSQPVLQLTAENTISGAPTVTSTVTIINTRTTSGLVITPSLLNPGVTNFQISGITGGVLYQNDGATPIKNGSFITLAQGAAGLKFTPTRNSLATGSFVVQQSIGATLSGLLGNTSTGAITVTLGIPTITPAATLENLQTTSGLVIAPDPLDSRTQYFQIAGVVGGTVYQNNGTTVIKNGTFITLAQAELGLKFTPTKNSLSNGSFTIQQAITPWTQNLIGTRVSVTVTVTPDNPTVTGATTTQDVQSQAGLLITPNPLDPNVTYFQVTSVTGGTLYLNDGTTIVRNNSFITVAQGKLGLKFTPTTNSLAAGRFSIQQSATDTVAGLIGQKVPATITVTANYPGFSNAATTQNIQSSTGLVVTPNPQDTAVRFFQINSISGGNLYLNNGTTLITNGQFITLAQAAAGLKFTPLKNSLVAGSFIVRQATTASAAGLTGETAVPTISVSPELATVSNTTTTENLQTTSGLFITPAGLNSAITNFQITSVSGGNLYLSDGTTIVRNNSFITVAQGAAGLKFTPSTNSLSTGRFIIQESTNAFVSGLQGEKIAASITVVPDVPTVTGATVFKNQQNTSGLVITPNAYDPRIAYFQITGIGGGTLYLNDGTTQITNGMYITVAQAELGLKFLMTPWYIQGGFVIRQSTGTTSLGLVGGSVVAKVVLVKS
jgi:hypothetical protein